MTGHQVHGRILLLPFTQQRAVMPHDSYVRYARWKGDDSLLMEGDAALWERLPIGFLAAVLMLLWLVLLVVRFLVPG